MPYGRQRIFGATTVELRPRRPNSFSEDSIDAISISNSAQKVRAMRQVATSIKDGQEPLLYEFPFAISSFSHQPPIVQYSEIPRPLNVPIVDPTSSSLAQCSFEFLVAVPYDSLDTPVDSTLMLLHDFATDDIPVEFDNVHTTLNSFRWRINGLTYSITRTNTEGKATAAQVQISLIEFQEAINRFIKLPKFSYAVPNGKKLTDSSGEDPETGKPKEGSEAWWIMMKTLKDYGPSNPSGNTASDTPVRNNSSSGVANSGPDKVVKLKSQEYQENLEVFQNANRLQLLRSYMAARNYAAYKQAGGLLSEFDFLMKASKGKIFGFDPNQTLDSGL